MRLVERWHGKEDGRIQCMLGPHANDTVSPNLFRKVRDLAEDRELRIFYHLSEAQSQVDYIVEQHGGKQPVQFLADLDFLGPSLIAVHAIYLKEHEIALLARHGVHIAHSPGFNGRRGRAAPVPTMLRNGVNVTLGTDTPSGDMFDAMRLGLIVARIMEHEATWPTPDDYLAMATINGARALGLEGEVGSLEVGKKADIVLINLDRLHLRPMGRPISTLVHYGMGADVDVVLVDGRLLVANGCLIGVDEDELLQLAQTIMENNELSSESSSSSKCSLSIDVWRHSDRALFQTWLTQEVAGVGIWRIFVVRPRRILPQMGASHLRAEVLLS